ncbi:MAG: hypothetical protein M3N54_10375 [Acidobacteriota bacterium]|nr:hypothetical protein [Acidobacteriota bacterium]
MFYKPAAIAALSIAALWAQSPALELKPDMDDPGVTRAQQDVARVQTLINEGALPRIRLRQAQEELETAKDMSILRQSVYAKDLMPEQADQMVIVAQRIVLRKQRSMIEMQQLVSSGIISRSEAEATGADYDRAQAELHLAESRARLVQQMAESLRIEKNIASLETQIEAHPDWAGKVYTRYDGRGIFTPADLSRVSSAFTARFMKPLPISAEGETALHRSLGFDHRGRVDVAVNPDQPEGLWLMKFLESNKIPYFAFRMAVAGKATGAHIHMGPQSTRLVMSATQ